MVIGRAIPDKIDAEGTLDELLLTSEEMRHLYVVAVDLDETQMV